MQTTTQKRQETKPRNTKNNQRSITIESEGGTAERGEPSTKSHLYSPRFNFPFFLYIRFG